MEYASKGLAGTALGFGIGGAAMSLANGGLGNLLGGLGQGNRSAALRRPVYTLAQSVRWKSWKGGTEPAMG